jgi:hypothetical protein
VLVSISGTAVRLLFEQLIRTITIHQQDQRIMRYMMIIKLAKNSETGRNYEAGKPPTPELIAAMGKLQEQLAPSGALLSNGELFPDGKGARIKAAGGRITITDGPFTESKEVIGGYAILRANSKQEAIRMGEDWMNLHINVLGAAFEAEMEIREMMELPCPQG